MSLSRDKSEANKPDRDSLMALQALLTIRTESMGDSESQSPSPPVPSEHTSITGVHSNSTNPDTTLAKAVPSSGTSEAPNFGAGNVASQPPLQESAMKPETMTVHPQHAVGHYGTPYVLPSRAPVGYGNNPYNQHGFHGPGQAQNNGFGGYQFFVPQGTAGNAVLQPPPQAAAAMIVPSAALPGKDTKSTASLGRGSSSGRKRKKSSPSPTSSLTKSSHATSNQHAEELSAAEQLIRKEEIEAALRSKPQRGRKRENLSAQERLELTRTRNREHAKSTRIRKKARYQELLDKEQEYDEMQKLQDLAVRRRHCLMEFLSIRSRMLKTFRDSTTDAAASLPPDNAALAASAPRANNDSSLQSDTRVVSFADGLSKAGEPQDLKPAPQDTSHSKPTVEFTANNFEISEKSPLLNGVVENIETFQFERMGALSLEPHQAAEGISPLRGISAMKKADRELLTRVEEQYGKGVVPTLSYRVKGSDDGVAIGHEGIGYAEIEVTMQGTDQLKSIVKSLIFKLRFAPGSSKLSSVEWSEIDSTRPDVEAAGPVANNQGDCPSSSSGESSLGCQKSFPSVVSLDQGTTYQGPPSTGECSGEKAPRKDTEDGNGPGMHI